MPAPGARPRRPARTSPAMGRGFGSGNAVLHGGPLGDFLFPALGDAADRQSPLPTICGHAPSINFENRMLVPLVRSEEHTSELQSLMRISYAVFCLKKKKIIK